MSFVPPDGRFELFSYHVSHTNQLPLYVTPSISYSQGGSFGTAFSSSSTPDGGAASSDSVHLSVTIGGRPIEGKSMEEVAQARRPRACSAAQLLIARAATLSAQLAARARPLCPSVCAAVL